MARSQHIASRFFAAFYRWNRYSQQPVLCSRFASHNCRPIRRIPALYSSRCHHESRLLYQNEQTQLQSKEEEGHLVAEISHEALDSTENRLTREGRQDLSPQHPEANTEDSQRSITTKKESEGGELKNAVRQLMRQVPSSVAVITAYRVEPGDIKPQPLGIVVSSLSSVSLDPPTISFNVKEPSKTLDSIRAAKGLFRVHFLASNERSAKIADQFTHGNHLDAYEARRRTMKIYSPANLSDPSASPSLAPKLYEHSVVAAMECKVTQEVSVADHIIVVAQVDTMESKRGIKPTLMYRDGKYIHDNHVTPLRRHSLSEPNTQLGTVEFSWSIYEYPLFPGQQERRDYHQRLKYYIKDNPQYTKHNKSTACKMLETATSFPDGTLGINLRGLIGECTTNTRTVNGQPQGVAALPSMAEFWGRLTPSDIEKIINKVKHLVKEDPKSLSIDFRRLYNRIGLSALSTGILVSDILEPLRAEGLVGPFKPNLSTSRGRSKYVTLEAAERVEQKLIQHLKFEKYDAAIRYTAVELVEAIHERPWVKSYIKQNRYRFHVETKPELFSSSKMDIFGEVTLEEARVVVARLSRYFHGGRLDIVRERLRVPRVEILRRIRVHPMVSGIDPDFFFSKIQYMHESTRSLFGLKKGVDQMLEPWFARKVTWEDLEGRVKQYVRRVPFRAVSWGSEDRLAAMGLDHRAIVQDPSWSIRQEGLSSGPVIEILLARELKNFYGKGNDAQNKAIADFFIRKYGYEVDSSDNQTRSAGDDLHDVILRNLKLGVMEGKEAEELLKAERFGTVPIV